MSLEVDASAVNEAIREPAPELRQSESLVIDLQRGLIDPVSGIWQLEAEVREMTGSDEEYLASIDSKKDITYSEYMAALLKRAVLKIGSLNIQDNQYLIDNLSIGDRDVLFLGVIKATYGRTKDFQVGCPHCAKSNDIVMDLEEDFKVNKPSINLHDPIVVKLRNGKNVKMRVPTIGDTSYVSKKAENVSVQNTLMISRCTVWPDGDQPEDVEEWAKSLNVADRNKMVKALLNIKAGPNLEAVNVPCAHCGENMSIAIDWISLLLS